MLDTSVLVAALRSELGASRELLHLVLRGNISLLVSVPLMLEYEAVLKREDQLAAFGLTAEEVDAFLDALAATCSPVRLHFHWRPVLRDANDDMVFETAVNGSADGLVTFNVRDFVSAGKKFDVGILTPREALALLEEK